MGRIGAGKRIVLAEDTVPKAYHPLRKERISLKKPPLSADKRGFFDVKGVPKKALAAA